MTNATKQELILPCECFGLIHVIRVSTYSDDETVSIEFFAEPRTFWERVREAWRAFHGRVLVQDVVLSRERGLELGDFLLCNDWRKETPPRAT